MKKLASFALAFALCAACAAPVLADETKTTIITTTIASTYTVDIPANTAIALAESIAEPPPSAISASPCD